MFYNLLKFMKMKKLKNFHSQLSENRFRELHFFTMACLAQHSLHIKSKLISFVLFLLVSSLPFGSTLFAQIAKPAELKECKTVTPPEAVDHEKEIAKQLAIFTENFLKDGEAKMATVVPVQIHIVRKDDGTGGVSYATVQAEIANYVNVRFAPINVSFLECNPVNYINSTTYYNLSGDAEGDAMSVAFNVPNVLNIYFVNDPDGACGWARFPFLLPSDYIVIANSCANNTSTLVHEIGHYFDLYHTHETAFGVECVDGSNCWVAGDLLCDTPADPNISGDVTAFPACVYTGGSTDPCNNDPYAPSTINIMSYSQKECRTLFTAQQNARMLFTISTSRSYLDYGCVGAPPVVLTCPVNTTVASCQTQAQVNASFTAWLATASGTGGCNGVLTNNNTGAPPACGGSRTVTFTYTSDCDPTETCQATFNVSPSPQVAINCPGNMTVSHCMTQAQVNAAYSAWLASATAVGGCNGALTNNSPGAPLICSPTAVVRNVTFTYISSCPPNSTSCSATFTLQAYPNFTVPANTASTVPCPANIVQPLYPLVVDACGKILTPTGPVIVNNPNPITCEGTRTFTWTYTDCAGHQKTWSHVTTVEREPFGVPANGGALVACPDQTDVQPTPPVVTSHCGEVLTPVITATAKPGCEGNRNWNFTYTDCEGNTATWKFIYTVEYQDFSVPPSETVNVECPLNANQPTPPVVYDNCGNLLNAIGPDIASVPNAYGCEGSRQYSWTYKDCEGNTNVWSKTYNFQYTADFFVYPDGEDFVACVGYAQPPVPPTIYDICGQPIKVTGPVVTESIANSGCSGWRNFTFMYTDCGGHSHPWSHTYYINDNQAPQGTCPSSSGNVGGPVAVNVTNLPCIDAVPCPDDYDFTNKIEQLLLAGNFFDVCSGDDLIVTLESYTDIWECNDADGDGIYTFGRTFYFHIADPCGNEYPDICSVTYSGVCLPIQSFAQKDWGNEGGLPGSSMGITDYAIVQNLIANEPIVLGGTNRSLTLGQAQCVMDMLPATGGPDVLANCHQTNCTGCNPMVNGGIHNSLAGGMIGLSLNMRFNNLYRGLNMNQIRNQGLNCIEVHECIKTCEGNACQLHLFDNSGEEYLYPYTMGGLRGLANLYLDGGLDLSPGQETIYGTALNQAVGAANDYWSENGATPANACSNGLKPGDGGDKVAIPIGKPNFGDKLDYRLVPNPTGNDVRFQLSELAERQKIVFEIYNQLGQQVLRRNFGMVSYVNEQIDLSNIGAGLYIVSVKAGDQRFEQKLVVNK